MRHGTGQGSSLRRFQEGKNTANGCGSGLAAVAQVEDEAGIAHCFTAEPSGRYVTDAEEFFHLAEQIHAGCPYVRRLGGTLNSNAIPTCLGTYL